MILFASPLVAVKNVIATKSADSIPLPFTVAGLINCSLWSIVGLLLLNDFNLYFPSMMGLVCALLQLFLKGIYGGNDVDSSTVEMNKIHSV
jgi:solute carrier family 50 (sugar transporter)